VLEHLGRLDSLPPITESLASYRDGFPSVRRAKVCCEKLRSHVAWIAVEGWILLRDE
jgi:hypothetical protein